MTVSVIKNENICAVTESVLLSAKKFQQSNQQRGVLPPIFIIVPDRATLNAEKILTRDACLLNTRVLTFSMLYHVLAGDDPQRVLDKTSAVLYMWRAINDVRANLTYFGRSADQYAFGEKMFNTINQLHSCLADFNNLEKNAREAVTKRKMHDIALIRARYAELTSGHIDGGGELDWLIKNIPQNESVKMTHFYIAGFDYLSIQRAEVVRLLMKYGASFTVGSQSGSEFEGFLNETRFNLQ